MGKDNHSSSASGRSKLRGVQDMAFKGAGNLIKLLPTGTVFLFQFLSPLLTNNGHCFTINKYLTGVLVAGCAFSCCFSSFTDSFVGSDGLTHYGIVTFSGLWTSSSSASGSVDLSAYKLRLSDIVHAFLSLMVFAVVALMDPNTMDCFYPSFESTQTMLVMALPPLVGAVASSVFVIFPNNRHGIGYPSSRDSQDNS